VPVPAEPAAPAVPGPAAPAAQPVARPDAVSANPAATAQNIRVTCLLMGCRPSLPPLIIVDIYPPQEGW
jgi:hypothetical protein